MQFSAHTTRQVYYLILFLSVCLVFLAFSFSFHAKERLHRLDRRQAHFRHASRCLVSWQTMNFIALRVLELANVCLARDRLILATNLW